MFENYIGQEHIKRVLSSLVSYHKTAPEPMQHILITGPSGTGKSTLVNCIEKELGTQCISLLAPMTKTADLIRALCTVNDKDMIFLDEIQSLDGKLIEMLFPVMQDGILFTPYQGKLTKFRVPKVTIIGATTHQGKLPVAFLNRFALTLNLMPYTKEELCQIARLHLQDYISDDEHTYALVNMCRDVPRILINIIKHLKLYLKSANEKEVSDEALYTMREFLDINEIGLNSVDFKILNYLDGVPSASLKTLGSVLSIEPINIEQVHEPYLLKLGFIRRDSSGRVLTDKGRNYLRGS